MNRLLQLLTWALRAAVFILLFGLALKNGEFVSLNFFFGLHWEVPVSLLVLLCFGLGALLGLTAAFSSRITNRPDDRPR